MKKIIVISLLFTINICSSEINNITYQICRLSTKDYFEDKAKNERVKNILREIEQPVLITDLVIGYELFDLPTHCSKKLLAKRIIRSDIDINKPRADAVLPLTVACYNQDWPIIKLLLEFGADPFKKGWNNLNTFEYLLWTIETNKDHENNKNFFKSTLTFLTKYCEEIGLFNKE